MWAVVSNCETAVSMIFSVCLSALLLQQLNVICSSLRSPLASNTAFHTDALVVGSGITGCVAAHYLQKNGTRVLLCESRDTVGGNMNSRKGAWFIFLFVFVVLHLHLVDGFLFEEGPNSFQTSPAWLKLAKDTGLLEELVIAEPRLPRYIYWNGNLHALPMSLMKMISFQLIGGSCLSLLLSSLSIVFPFHRLPFSIFKVASAVWFLRIEEQRTFI
jgi:hypothetical protein